MKEKNIVLQNDVIVDYLQFVMDSTLLFSWNKITWTWEIIFSQHFFMNEHILKCVLHDWCKLMEEIHNIFNTNDIQVHQPCHTKFIFRKYWNTFAFSKISQHWDDTDS